MTRTTARRHPLRGWYVISLRPLHHHGGLRRAAAALGAKLFAVSTLALEPLDAGPALASALQCAQVVVTSPSAVALARPGRALPQRRGQRWFALGAGSAAALRRRGITGVRVPAHGSDSEALLALPELRDVRGREIGLVTAPGGRGLVARGLRARGARLHVAETYRRVPRQVAPARLAALAALPPTQGLVLTSLDAFEPFWRALDASARARLRAVPCVVASDRLAAHAATLGFTRIVRAAGMRPAQLLGALASHVAERRIR